VSYGGAARGNRVLLADAAEDLARGIGSRSNVSQAPCRCVLGFARARSEQVNPSEVRLECGPVALCSAPRSGCAPDLDDAVMAADEVEPSRLPPVAGEHVRHLDVATHRESALGRLDVGRELSDRPNAGVPNLTALDLVDRGEGHPRQFTKARQLPRVEMGQRRLNVADAWDAFRVHTGIMPDWELERNPHSVTSGSYPENVVTLKRTIATNVRKILGVAEGHSGVARLASLGVKRTNAARVLKAEQSYGVDLLEEIAKACRVEPWLLCVPNMDITRGLDPEADYMLTLYRQTPAAHRAAARAILENLARLPAGQGIPQMPAASPPTPSLRPGSETLPATRPVRRRTKRTS
jgi:hypothetical protein